MPPLPPAASVLWEVYQHLAAGRPQGMGGPARIPPSEILAWQQLHGVVLNPWELEVIAALDQLALDAMTPPKA